MCKFTDELGKLEKKVNHMAQNKFEASEAELAIFRELLDFGAVLFHEFLRISADQEQRSGTPIDSQGCKMEHKGKANRQYQSIFGKVDVIRPKYYSTSDKTVYPLDARLNLPNRQESYLLQQWLCMCAIDKDYRESVELLNTILGLKLNPMQSQRIIGEVGGKVAAYYEQKAPPEPESEGSCLCFEADGKGVRIVESDREAAAVKEASGEGKRLMKGQKRGVKKMATVSLSFSFDPVGRTPEEMLKSLHDKWNKKERAEFKELMKSGAEKPRVAKNIHKRAFIGAQKEAIGYAVKDLQKRDPERKKDIIAIVDAGIGLEAAIREELSLAGEDHRLVAVILDIIHVTEYVWKVANAYKGEKHPRRLAWVEKIILLILAGRVEEVIETFENIEGRPQIKRSGKTAIRKAITYFENHKHKMDYKTYLEKGYPISTGLVEGSCGHLVKERMESSRMRWSINGAQKILDARATKLNGDLDGFFHNLKANNKGRLYKSAA